MPLVSSWLVQSARDAGDVLTGYRQLFGLLVVVAGVGLVAAWLLQRRISRRPRVVEDSPT